jgi:hypothetical protein
LATAPTWLLEWLAHDGYRTNGHRTGKIVWQEALDLAADPGAEGGCRHDR